MPVLFDDHGRDVRTVNDHRSCREDVLAALNAAAAHRGNDLSWIDHEREVVATAANVWAMLHNYPNRVTVDDVERVERGAVGHYDYASKLALYVADLIVTP